MRHIFIILIAITGLTSAAYSADKSGSLINEARFGAYYHNIERYGEESLDLNAELLFQPIQGNYSNSLMQFLLTPRPHIGATVNTEGYASFVYTGVTWTKNLFDTPFFIEGAFGGGLHNGNIGSARVANEANLGCTLIFREAASLGANLPNNWRVMGTIEHFSNAGLCSNNQGMTNAGLRFGKLF